MRPIRLILRVLLQGFWLIFPTAVLQAQPLPLFEVQAVVIDALPSQVRQRWQVLQRLPMVSRLQVVRLPAQLWHYRSFTLAVDAAGRLVPGRTGSAELTVRRGALSVLSEEAVAWNGQIYAGAERVGEVSLVVLRTGAVTGQVVLGSQEYWVRPLGGRLHALATIDPSKYPRQRRGRLLYAGGKRARAEKQIDTAGTRLVQETTRLQARCGPGIVRVLVLYTPEAAQGRDIDGIIYAAINDANQAYRNSQIHNLELRLAHKQLFSFEVTGYYPDDDAKALSQDPRAQALRDQHEADVVVLLIDSARNEWGRGVLGAVPKEAILLHGSSGEAVVNAAQVNPYAYAIVQVDYAGAGRYALAHEIGHIQGAQHYPSDGRIDLQRIPYAQGHRFAVYGCAPGCRTHYYATIMSDTWEPSFNIAYTRIRYFSNPSVTYRGVITGRPDRNNARVLQETANVVANFRGSNELGLSIVVSSSSAPLAGKYTFSAQTCNAAGALAYTWRVSTNPFDQGPIVSTRASFTRYLSPGDYFITLEVQSKNGGMAHAVYALTVYEAQVTVEASRGTVLRPGDRSIER
ncbi:M12 family metallo-peptidase [Rhodothermus profundi]|uniref:Metallo-peptidase family M12B Reprolysin-like n=1 Tax=Rhodothermus profundi TaxID=633813 RepID=A0A1M6SH05_9BACT|nr:M12 family metallo-peptidase [Rhodothermus profundi]SHK43940.1 Metallo-peptidase family M12B Reprolysin-like [Rhodothermus profundi]